MDTLPSVNSDIFHTNQNSLSECGFDDIRQLYGENMSDDVIFKSVGETCNFFNIGEPAIVTEEWTTGIYANNDSTLQDDVHIFNREQLLNLGISGTESLDLVMTHEGTQRILQDIEHIDFNTHQEELCCDYMIGVRAGLNNIDISQIEDTLMYTLESETHPVGVERVESIEAGLHFAQHYFAEYNMAPRFYDCLENFKDVVLEDNIPTEINSDTMIDRVSFHGKSSDKDNLVYYQKKLKNAVDWQNYHLKRSDDFARKGDEDLYKDHKSRADVWDTDVKKYTKLVKEYEVKVKK